MAARPGRGWRGCPRGGKIDWEVLALPCPPSLVELTCDPLLGPAAPCCVSTLVEAPSTPAADDLDTRPKAWLPAEGTPPPTASPLPPLACTCTRDDAWAVLLLPAAAPPLPVPVLPLLAPLPLLRGLTALAAAAGELLESFPPLPLWEVDTACDAHDFWTDVNVDPPVAGELGPLQDLPDAMPAAFFFIILACSSLSSFS